jgi:hypothetical protein
MSLSPEPTHFLKTVSSPKQIHDHPINNSPAKALYSFPHAERFPKRNLASPCHAAFYDVNEATYKIKRATSLGKGNKYDFTRNGKDVPAPNTYYPTNLAIGTEKKKGFSFGLSRDSAPQHGIAPFLKNAALNPGPGAYTPVLPKSHKTVSFRIKLDQNSKQNANVGPGKYEIPASFEPAKRIFNSKFQSTKSIKFAPLKALVYDTTGNPRSSSNGPANKENEGGAQTAALSYDTRYQINTKGVFFNSKYKNSKCRSFGKANRDSQKRTSDMPGPGNYMLPSEFGIYESSTATKQA